ncbi:MORN repeat-containing protein 5 [Paraphysoderma sedebokerense]|nr:MORN repeat-containing protein 5 [Paraphysoderma sedebokerense]
MAFHGSPFQADVVNGRIEGSGKYTFKDGNVYIGDLKDGQFHGKGTIHFAHGGRYEAVWENGIAIKGSYTFEDNLAYESSNWDYLTQKDRRFYSERLNGIHPADATQLTNSGKLPPIPISTYDTGDGYYDPSTGFVHDYLTHAKVREVDQEERKWILENCRIGEFENNIRVETADKGDIEKKSGTFSK